jgi:hypothetical protein
VNNEELQHVVFTKYYYSDQIRRRRWVGYVEHIGEVRNARNILVGKPEEKTSHGRPRSRCEDVEWFHLAEDYVGWLALVNTVIHLRVP